MNTRWLRAAACVTASGLFAAAAIGCEDPVDIGSSGDPVGTTQTTSADLPSGNGSAAPEETASDTSNASTINNVGGQTSDQASAQQAASSPQAAPQQGQPQAQSSAQPTSSASPVDSSGYGTLPMPNAETSVGSYSTSTILSAGGTSGVDVSGAPPQNASGSNVSSASASNAINNSTVAAATVVVAAGPAPNDVAASNPRSSQSLSNAGANQSAVINQQRRGSSNSAIQPSAPNAYLNNAYTPNQVGNARPSR